MNPLPDRVVLLSLVITVCLCFALAAWTVRLHPSEAPLQWRAPSRGAPAGALL
ncbi:MAG: hypothetical protein ACK5FE_11270 [Cyanobacteriota bacterium]|jgi:hypothetical protein